MSDRFENTINFGSTPMPDDRYEYLSGMPERSTRNLAALALAYDGKDMQEQGRIDAALLGALSNHVDPEVWASCLKSAQEAFEFGRKVRQ